MSFCFVSQIKCFRGRMFFFESRLTKGNGFLRGFGFRFKVDILVSMSGWTGEEDMLNLAILLMSNWTNEVGVSQRILGDLLFRVSMSLPGVVEPECLDILLGFFLYSFHCPVWFHSGNSFSWLGLKQGLRNMPRHSASPLKLSTCI